MRTLLSSLLLISSACALLSPDEAGERLRVMTFNIRYGSADDGENAWPKRRELVMDVVRDFAPDVLGLQEALRYQIDEIEKTFPHLAEVGVGRDDGKTEGEYSAILFDQGRLRALESGTFWLSDTPEVIASTSWGNSIPRICTWARFEDLESGGHFHVFNTHWDHRSQPSRERSAELILARVRKHTGDGPALLLGDFNAGEDNPAFRALVSDEVTQFTDSYRQLHPKEKEVGTFNSFRGRTGGPKIDAVLVTPHWRVEHAEIVRTNREGRYPSDHFPVSAVLVRNPE